MLIFDALLRIIWPGPDLCNSYEKTVYSSTNTYHESLNPEKGG